MDLFKINLIVYIVLFFGLAFIWRSFIVYKSIGTNPMKLVHDESAQGFNAIIFKMLSIAQGLNCALFIFSESFYKYLSPIVYLQNDNIALTGIVLSWIALIWILIAQSQMSDSWRIGFDDSEKTTLRTNGLFRVSRNPIFFGIILADLAFILILPNALTLCILLVGYVSIETQVRLEEAHLTKKHGSDYLSYKEKVRRWV